MKQIAVYPGTFDPITNAHIDLVQRGLRFYDKIILAVAHNPEKSPLFTVQERVKMAKDALKHLPGVMVEDFDGLLVEYCLKRNAKMIIRGLRAVSDFEYEFQMALMNRRLAPEVETIFMMPNEIYSYLSSRLVKEIARLGGSVKGLVPPQIELELHKKFRKEKK
ncbi:MAG: pantetheine-phosphate adenylyltransferase [bacterium]|nr:pantetheine-phosphate adenylyltransferase [bacterium]